MSVLRCRLARAAALLSAALLGAACGSSVDTPGGAPDNGEASKSAAQIVKDTADALRSVTSYHLAGSLLTSGTPEQLDFKFAGNNASGSLVYKGVHFDVIEVNGAAYVHGSEMWKEAGGTPLADLIGDRWVSFTSGSSAATSLLQSLGDFEHPDKLASALATGAGTSPKKGTTTSINGEPAISVDNGNAGTLFVATTGTPYPLRISRTTGDRTGQVDLGEFNESFTITAPTNVVDASALGNSLGSSSSSST